MRHSYTQALTDLRLKKRQIDSAIANLESISNWDEPATIPKPSAHTGTRPHTGTGPPTSLKSAVIAVVRKHGAPIAARHILPLIDETGYKLQALNKQHAVSNALQHAKRSGKIINPQRGLWCCPECQIFDPNENTPPETPPPPDSDPQSPPPASAEND